MSRVLRASLWVGSLLATLAVAGVSRGESWELSGSAAVEARSYLQSAAYPGQDDSALSFALTPELYREWNRGEYAALLIGFTRLDASDDERTHFDLREAYWQWAKGSSELRVGVQKVFWGVAESQHLIDVINQTDLIENIDQEDKLGQPMVLYKHFTDWGAWELYLMSGFRERTFPGRDGRFRGPLSIADARYESSAERAHLDTAVRWSHYIGAWDMGLAHFHGTSREPELRALTSGSGPPQLEPFYALIDQSSLDAQLTRGDWILKFEGLYRSGGAEDYFAAVAGFEYTRVGILGTDHDLGFLGEWHGDDRGDRATTPFEGDVFVGARYVLNDVQNTEFLGGAIVDVEGDGSSYFVEASRRVGDRWTVSLESRGIFGSDESDPLYLFRRDDYLQVEVAMFF